MPRKYTYLAFTNAVEGKDDAFNAWYTGQHVPDVLQVPGFVAATRYRVSDVGTMGAAPVHRYLTVYEIESDNPEAVFVELGVRAPGMVMSDALDFSNLTCNLWEAVTEKIAPARELRVMETI